MTDSAAAVQAIVPDDAPPGVAPEPAAKPVLPPPSDSNTGDVGRATIGEEVPTLWLRRSDQVVVWLLTVALLVLLTMHWLRLSRWGSVSVELSSEQPREYFYSLDINSASWVEWAQLDGIGEKLARRIVADREERGPFRSASDVGRVRGIGPKLLEKLKPFLRGGSESINRSATND